jgi:hypothetical protein
MRRSAKRFDIHPPELARAYNENDQVLESGDGGVRRNDFTDGEHAFLSVKFRV